MEDEDYYDKGEEYGGQGKKLVRILFFIAALAIFFLAARPIFLRFMGRGITFKEKVKVEVGPQIEVTTPEDDENTMDASPYYQDEVADEVEYDNEYGYEESVEEESEEDDGFPNMAELERISHQHIVEQARRAGVSTQGTDMEILERIGHKHVVEQAKRAGVSTQGTDMEILERVSNKMLQDMRK